MRTVSTIQLAILSLILLICTPVHSQNSPQNGVLVTQWDNPLAVVPGTLTMNGVDFPAHTFTVHGTSANELFKMWRSDMREQTREISGRRPTVAKGVSIPGISSTPLTVIAETSGDRRDPYARMTIALASNDSTPITDTEMQQQYAQDLAVLYNQRLIDESIAERQKELAKAQKKNDRSGSNEAKVRKRLERTEAKLERTRNRREKAEAQKAEQEGVLIGLQRAEATTNSDRDRTRVIRARRKLADRESDVLKHMEREMKYESEAQAYREELPEFKRDQSARSEEIQKLEREINALESAKQNLQP